MSDFLIISFKQRLNWIVDGIKDNLPRNPDIPVNFSYGKIKKNDEDRYSYEYLSYSSVSTESDKLPQEEADSPRNLFNNQIGQFRTISSLGDNNLNIFCLDNPLNEEDTAESQWLLDELKALYDSRRQTNFQIIRIVFSYDLNDPENLNLQASTKILKEIIKSSSSTDLMIRTCYIDNQNLSGAAVALNKYHHDLLIPRMLGDFMMLMSTSNDKYNTFSAITGNRDIFSLGYAESMYYFYDIKRFYEIAHRKKLLEKINNDINEEESLNYDKKPFGLKDRIARLEKQFIDIPFYENISIFPASADYNINEIIKSLKPYLSKYITKLRNLENENILKDHKYKYIDREEIFEYYELDKDSLSENVKYYQDLLDLALSKDFRIFLKDILDKQEDSTQFTSQSKQFETNSGCNPFSIFFKKKKKSVPLEEIVKSENVKSHLDWKIIKKLETLLEEKHKFKLLQSKQTEIEGEIKNLESSLKKFKFTSHSKTIDKDNISDLNQLQKYHDDNMSLDQIIRRWNQRMENNKNLATLLGEDLKTLTSEDCNKLQFINWDETFPFIKNLDLKVECENLKKQSVPFVRLFVLPETALNLITYNIYSDNKKWIDEIKKDTFELSDKKLISAINSSHIASKICMFQFLQMTPEVVEGIVDAMQVDN